jgi:adenylate cyclase
MAEEKFRRKLTAILSADVAGYSRLMGEDEEATVRTLTSYREIMSTLIQKHQGRVVDSPGDNLLAEFASVLDAVRSAVEMQEELKARNAQLPDDRKMDFRIGINLGDVIEEGERIYGDGVNIAARVEGLAEPGGICISGTVYEHIKDKLALWKEYLGEHAVKNIKEPVRVYRVRMEPGPEAPKVPLWRRKTILAGALAVLIAIFGVGVWHLYFRPPPIERASIEKMAFPLPDKPSIAVLPFVNMSGDPKQEYFSDGISEEIINALSKTSHLFVIARESTFSYKGKQVKVQQIAHELGVRYILEGSVRKSEDRVRITAQLIDGIKGEHLWAERYDRELKDIFALQDEITIKIITALQVQLTEGEQARMWGKKSKNLDVLLKGMETLSLWRKGTKESHIRQGQVSQEIIDMAPDYAGGYRSLGWYYWYLAMIGESPRESIGKAFKLAQKALSLDESDSWSHALLGSIYLMMRKYEKAIVAGERSIELDPNGAMAHGLLGMTLSFADRPDEAIRHLNQGIRLNPFPAYWYFLRLGQSYIQKGQYEEALKAYKKALQRGPNSFANHAHLAITYVLLDRQEEAGAAAKKVLELYPNFSVERISKTLPFKNQAHLKLVVDAMRKAGLK